MFVFIDNPKGSVFIKEEGEKDVEVWEEKDNKEKEKQHPAAGQGYRGGWQEEEDEKKEDQKQERNKNQNLKLVRQQSTRLTCKNQLILYIPTMNNWYLEYTE